MLLIKEIMNRTKAIGVLHIADSNLHFKLLRLLAIREMVDRLIIIKIRNFKRPPPCPHQLHF